MVAELAEEVVDYEGAEEDPDMPAAPAPREASRRAHTPSQQAACPAFCVCILHSSCDHGWPCGFVESFHSLTAGGLPCRLCVHAMQRCYGWEST